MASPAVAERPGARSAPPAQPARRATPAPAPAQVPAPAAAAGRRPAGTLGVSVGAPGWTAGLGLPGDAAGARVRLAAPPSAEEVSLRGSGTFTPPQSVADFLSGHSHGGEVAVRFPGVAAGVIHVRKRGEKYSTPDLQAIDIAHPALEPLRGAKLSPLLAIEISNSIVTGYVTVSTGRGPVRGKDQIGRQIRTHTEELGLLGMRNVGLSGYENKLEQGALSLKTDLAFTLGGFLSGKGSFGLANDIVIFAAHAEADVHGVAKLMLDATRRSDGVIEGHAEIPVGLRNFSGNFILTFVGGLVDVTGTFRYATDTVSGEVTLVITDAQTARNVAYQHLPPEAIDASARESAGGSAIAAAPSSAGPKPGPRAVAGWGTLDVHYSEWLTGKALVVVDAKGYVTVIGSVRPPGKVEFPQTKLDWEHEIFAFEVRASYGLPYVGEVFLFAGVQLVAIAKIGPLILSKITIDGTYSTDPAILRSFGLSANLSLSALAGLRLRAEGGLGIRILKHDIKIGAALLATAGIRAYVDATPMIGIRELAAPETGRRREFYIHGEAEIAAQPFLALGGELFVKLITPWWSPVSDHTWTWPLGELLYPLPGEIGVGVDVDYVFGSGKLPTISPKKVDFNADRFMSDLMDDKVPHGAAAELQKPGRWNERLQAPPAPPARPQIKDSKGPAKKRDDKSVKDAANAWASGIDAVAALGQRGEAHPYAQPEIEAALRGIKSRYGFSILEAKAVGDHWEIAATLGKNRLTKPARIKRAPGGAPPSTDVTLPETTFDLLGARHRIFIVATRDGAALMIASDVPTNIEQFIRAALATSRIPDAQKRRELEIVSYSASEIRKLYVRVRSASTPERREAEARFLRGVEQAQAEQLQSVLRRIEITDFDRRYLLEGHASEYGTFKGLQVGDDLTPDHQPAVSALEGIAELRPFAGKRIQDALAGAHANQAWAILLHKRRHGLGRTYGRSRRADVQAMFRERVTRGVRAEAAALDVLKFELDSDANSIKTVYGRPVSDAAVWGDLPPDPPGIGISERARLAQRIRRQVFEGENRMQAQPLDWLVRDR